MDEKDMNMEMKRPGPHCPVIDVNGLISNGKQFDLDITLPDAYKKKYQFYLFKIKNKRFLFSS